MTLAIGHLSIVTLHFQRTFLKLLGPFHLNFICCLQQTRKESLYCRFRSHNQDGRHAYLWLNLTKSSFREFLYVASGEIVLKSYTNDDPVVTLNYFWQGHI